MEMMTYDCAELGVLRVQELLNHVVAPRPICLASTVDARGRANLSPFSFFNLFSVDPPIVVFSPSRRVRDGSVKHTLSNVMEVAQCVVNIVDHSMLHQMNLASSEYPSGVNEFEKAGFTMLDSLRVSPPRVAQARVQLECTVERIVPLGMSPGAGNLVIARVELIHVSKAVFGGDGKIDPVRIGAVGRLGADWYCQMVPQALFRLEKPSELLGIGVDALPGEIVAMGLLSGNELGSLGALGRLPSAEEMERFCGLAVVRELFEECGGNVETERRRLVELAQKYLVHGSTEMALRAVVLAGGG